MHSPYPFLILLLLLLSPFATATIFQVNFTDATVNKESGIIEIAPHENTVFGIGTNGTMEAKLTVSTTNITGFYLASCPVSNLFVRDPSYERRHSRIAHKIDSKLKDKVCNRTITSNNGPCATQKLKKDNHITFSVESTDKKSKLKQPNELYITFIYICLEAGKDKSSTTIKLSVEGKVAYSNQRARLTHLGFEEHLFPILSLIVTCILGGLTLILFLSFVIAKFLFHIHIPKIPLFVFSACCTKGLLAALTFVYFNNVGVTGTRARWYVYVRITTSALADVFYIVSVVSLAAGYKTFPSVWFVDGRSPVFIVYLGISLQILIVIAVKIMFPFESLTVVTYTFTAGAVALITIISSYRNLKFLKRYEKLIERAHIYVQTTPILRMQQFFKFNIPIVAIAYMYKIIAVGLWDFRLRRPDLMWASLEIADTVLLTWYTFCVFPRKKSSLYLNMSNVSNSRLQQAEAWRARQAGDALLQPDATTEDRTQDNGTSTSTVIDGQIAAEEGRAPAAPEISTGPQPPWISWSPGTPLPRPDSVTWGAIQVGRILRRERKLVPVLPSPIVLGTPADTRKDSPDVLELNVATPTVGPLSVPREFDEKGVEIGPSHPSEQQARDTLRSEIGSIAADIQMQNAAEQREREFQMELEERQQQRRARWMQIRWPFTGRGSREEENPPEDRANDDDRSQTNTSLTRDPSRSRFGDSFDIRTTASTNASCDGILEPNSESWEP